MSLMKTENHSPLLPIQTWPELFIGRLFPAVNSHWISWRMVSSKSNVLKFRNSDNSRLQVLHTRTLSTTLLTPVGWFKLRCSNSFPVSLFLFFSLPGAVLKQQSNILGWNRNLERKTSPLTTCSWCGTSSAATSRQFGSGRVKISPKKGKVLTESYVAPSGLGETAASYLHICPFHTCQYLLFQNKGPRSKTCCFPSS